MPSCVIDGTTIHSPADLYESLARQLDFPPWAGRNLDALWDTLTGIIAGPVAIEWRQAEAARGALGADLDRFLALFAEVAAAREDFSFRVTGPLGDRTSSS